VIADPRAASAAAWLSAAAFGGFPVPVSVYLAEAWLTPIVLRLFDPQSGAWWRRSDQRTVVVMR